MKLLDDINIDEIASDVEFQEKYIECINLYVDFRDQYRIRTLIYSGGPSTDAVATMKKKYEELINRLPEETARKYGLLGDLEIICLMQHGMGEHLLNATMQLVLRLLNALVKQNGLGDFGEVS